MALIEMRKLLNRFRKIIDHLGPSELPKKRDRVTPRHYLLSSFAVEHAPDPIYWILPDETRCIQNNKMTAKHDLER